MKQLFYSLAILAIIGTGCSQNNESNGHEHSEAVADAGATHQHENAAEELRLNDGQKWESDENTRTLVRKMGENISGFSGSELDQYQMLAASLQKDIDQLTAGCTMKGPAHDELHKWLLPYIEETGRFADSKSVDEAREHLKNLQSSIGEFNRYFE